MDVRIYENLYKIPIIVLPRIEQPFIGGNKITVYSRRGEEINYKEGHSFKKGKLIITNGESFHGALNKDKTSVMKGQYEWPSNQIYYGYFNESNLFETKGKANGKITFPPKSKDKYDKDTFECVFINGYPKGQGKYKFSKKTKNKIRLIEGNFDYNKSKDCLILVGEQILYDSDNDKDKDRNSIKVNYENSTINGNCEINTILNDGSNRRIKITGYYNKGIKEGVFTIKDNNNSFYLEANYKFGFKDGEFKIVDKNNNINFSKNYNIEEDLNTFFTNPIKKLGKKRFFQLIKSLVYINKFNQKYNISLYLGIPEISLANALIGQNGFDILTNILFYNLTKLDLENNNIENINNLKNFRLDNLNTLVLFNNKIKDINILSELNMNEIIDLELEKNSITSIDIFEKCKFKYLTNLGIANNPIRDISVFAKVSFLHLQTLNLYNMYLDNINIFSKCNFPNLTDLEMFGNKINDIEVLAKCNFPKLYILGLSCNYIENINVLSKCNFPLLYFLDLNSNIIEDISVFEKCNFPEIKIIKLSNNNIKSLKTFQKTKFKLLTYLEILNNPIDRNDSSNKELIQKFKNMKQINGFDFRL